ncbi:hypothetical protein V2G26_001522 [Clonostachys chloroleuca]
MPVNAQHSPQDHPQTLQASSPDPPSPPTSKFQPRLIKVTHIQMELGWGRDRLGLARARFVRGVFPTVWIISTDSDIVDKSIPVVGSPKIDQSINPYSSPCSQSVAHIECWNSSALPFSGAR